MATIEYYDGLISKANEEIANCESLKKMLSVLSNNAFNCATHLKKTHDLLSAGLAAKGITDNINTILDRANSIEKMQNNTEQAMQNIDTRIKELEEEIAYCEGQKQNLWVQMQSWLKKHNRNKNTNLEE